MNTMRVSCTDFVGIRLFGAVNKADSIPTVISDEDLGLDDDMEQYCSCEALIMRDFRLDNCRWFGEEDYKEPATSIPE